MHGGRTAWGKKVARVLEGGVSKICVGRMRQPAGSRPGGADGKG